MVLPTETSCNLGSINLSNMIDENGNVLFEKLDETIKLGINYLDSAIDAENYFDDKIEENQKYYRLTGLGVMGYADLLIKKGLKYGSDKALSFTRTLARFILDRAYYHNAMLAKEKGAAPVYEESKINNHYISKCSSFTQNAIKKYGLRNGTVLSIAPTGSISMLLGVNGGIEPYFAFEYERNDILGKRTVKANIVDKAPNEECLISAQEVSPKKHVLTQAVWQNHIDSSISKTCNLPQDATVDEVSEVFKNAHNLGLKGTTVYRDKCRQGVMNTPHVIKEGVKMPAENHSFKLKRKVEGKNIYYHIGYRTQKMTVPIEMFITTNKTLRTDVTEAKLGVLRTLLTDNGVKAHLVEKMAEKASKHKNTDKLAMHISMCLRHNIPIIEIVGKLSGEHESVASLVFQTNKILMSLIDDGEASEEVCPECGEKLIHSQGCLECSCGYSKC